MPFIGERVGGSHLSTLLLWQGLQKTAFEPLIVVHREGLLTEHLAARSIPWKLVPLHGFVGDRATPWGYASAAVRCVRPLVSFLRDVEAAIVHTNDLRMHMSWALPARVAGVRHLWHQRTVFARSRSTAIAARLAHRFACISTFCLQGLPKSRRERGRVIYNPIIAEHPDRTAARRTLIDELGVSADTSIVLFVGNLQAQKRPLVFVDAAARIAGDLAKPVVFAILGVDKEVLQPAARQRATEYGIDLRFLGFRHPPEPWIAAADVLLAPSVDEGFGRTLVEAMQVGTPVIASRSGGHPEVVRDGATGFLVPVDDAATMARVAVQVLTNPDLAAEIAGAARHEVDGRYTIERHVAAATALYGEILNGK